MKTFFDGIFMDKKILEDEGIEYPVKLEYFKLIDTEDVEAKYGIEIVKTDYINGKININSNKIKNITNYQQEIDKILSTFRNNEVTPNGMEDILIDMFIKI